MTPLVPFDRSTMQVLPKATSSGTTNDQPNLMPSLSPVEQRRRLVQSSLASGWATWVFDDLAALASLPSAVTVRPVICSKNNAHCLDSLIVNNGGEGGATNVRCGSHAYDRSYAEVESLEFEGLHLRLRWGFIDGRLNWAATCVIIFWLRVTCYILHFMH
jgi:hypothetical protein